MDPDWNDLRIFLMVARVGTISGAGERLGIEHSTVSRRMDRLEKLLGVPLFDRRRTGYALTDQGYALIGYAERMETTLYEAMQDSAGATALVSGAVRVGTPEAFGICVLAPALARLRQDYPALDVQLMAQPQFPSLVTREVEILVTLEPPDTGRYKIARIAEVDYYPYCSPDYLARHPDLRTLDDIARLGFVDYLHDGSVSERYRILEELFPDPRRVFTSNSVLAQRAAAAAGLGIVLLTPYVAEQYDDLVCVLPREPVRTRGLWIAAPEDLLRLRRYRIVWSFIRELVESAPRHFRSAG